MLTAEEIERREIFQLACSNITTEAPAKAPVSTYDVLHAMEVTILSTQRNLLII